MTIRIAIVIPWFGHDLHGGAEQHAWQIANRLQSNAISVTVLTTCCKSFLDDWATNHYIPGEYIENNLKIIRFSVDSRDKGNFDRTVAKLLSLPQNYLVPGTEIIPWKLEETYLQENINSTDMLNYIQNNIDTFDVFIFTPYLFTPIIKGVSLVKNKAILLPCLHDEPYAYLESVKKSFYECGRIMFNSHGEQLLACNLYGDWILHKSTVTGAGVEMDMTKLQTPSELDTTDLGDFILYLGRKCAEKNVPLLIDAFEEFIRQTDSRLKLLLAGPSDIPIKPTTNQVRDLGVVSEDFKYKLLRNCRALVNPSENESFSRVIFEAWFAGKPVLVNRKCLATYTALVDSGFAGWHADIKESFISAFKEIASASQQTLQEMGKKGMNFATSMADWNTVINRIINELNLIKFQNTRIALTNEKLQFLIVAHTIGESSPSARDALSQITILSTKGYKVNAYCNQVTTKFTLPIVNTDYLTKHTSPYSTVSIIQWISRWSELLDITQKIPGRKILRLMKLENPDELRNFLTSTHPETVICASENLLVKLRSIWDGNAVVLPPCYGPEIFPHHSILLPLFKKFDDIYVNVLIIGQLYDKYSKYLADAVALYQNRYGENIRFFIVSDDHTPEKYFQQSLSASTKTYIIPQQNSTPSELYTYYKVTDVALYLPDSNMKSQENILLLQYWGTPIIVLHKKNDEVTRNSCIVLPNPNPALVASAIHTLSIDSEERECIIHAGYKNVLNFSQGAISYRFISILRNLGIDI